MHPETNKRKATEEEEKEETKRHSQKKKVAAAFQERERDILKKRKISFCFSFPAYLPLPTIYE